jgi:cytochrome c biogenesis protein CcdA
LRGASSASPWEILMNGIIYLIGLVVVVVAVASFFGFR